MRVQLQHRPGSAVAHVALQPGESCTAEGGAMIAMSGNMGVETTTHQKSQGGGLLKAAARLLAKESFFLNHFSTQNGQPGELWLSTSLAGDMQEIHLSGGNGLIIEAGGYVASTAGVSVNVGWQGFKNLASRESLFWLETSGEGTIVISSFGAIYPIDIDGEYIVDTGHIVAFEKTLDFKLSKAGSSWIASFLGGEGLVCRFQGRGRVWCQSHSQPGFGRTLGPMLRPR